MTSRSLYLGLLLSGYFTIMGVLLIWYGWAAPPRLWSPAWTVTLWVLPLFTALRGLLHGRTQTVKWSLFLSLVYFSQGIVEAWSDAAARPYALIEIAASVCWLTGGVLYVRASRGRHSTAEDVNAGTS